MMTKAACECASANEVLKYEYYGCIMKQLNIFQQIILLK